MMVKRKKKVTPQKKIAPREVMAGITLMNLTIPAGESMSNTIVPVGTINYLLTPPVWTTSYLTMQVSFDGTNFYDLFAAGQEVTFTSIPRGVALEVSFASPKGGIAVRLRSGPHDHPVPQEDDRVFTAVVLA